MITEEQRIQEVRAEADSYFRLDELMERVPIDATAIEYEEAWDEILQDLEYSNCQRCQ